MDGGKGETTPDFMAGPSDGVISRRKKKKKEKEAIFPLFPWLTDRRATVHSKDYLLSKGISAITGEMQCKICKYRGFLVFDLHEKIEEISIFLAVQLQDTENSSNSKKWMTPKLPSCPRCVTLDCFSPVIPRRKRDIDWLFLFLGRMLRCCTAEQLKYFLKHNRVYLPEKDDTDLFLVYAGVCLQLYAAPLP